MNIIGIAGTNVPTSTNLKLINYVQKHFGEQATINTFDLQAVPVFVKATDQKVPAEVRTLIDQIAAADGVVIATPEYDHSVPAVLLNLLEWVSYTSQALKDKPVLIIGASYGRLGTARAQVHLRQVLANAPVSAEVMPGGFLLSGSLRAFDEQGQLTGDQDVQKLTQAFDDFQKFIASHK